MDGIAQSLQGFRSALIEFQDWVKAHPAEWAKMWADAENGTLDAPVDFTTSGMVLPSAVAVPDSYYTPPSSGDPLGIAAHDYLLTP